MTPKRVQPEAQARKAARSALIRLLAEQIVQQITGEPTNKRDRSVDAHGSTGADETLLPAQETKKDASLC